jgi:biofilm protein TabA
VLGGYGVPGSVSAPGGGLLDTTRSSASFHKPLCRFGLHPLGSAIAMILDSLDSSGRYQALGTGIALGLAYLQSFDLDTPDGRYTLDGDDLFALVQSYGTGPATGKKFEAHRAYIDIQFVARGSERILHTRSEGLAVEIPYLEEKDVEFFADPYASSSILLGPGDFAIFFPNDAHKPGCMAGGRTEVKKVVVKVSV